MAPSAGPWLVEDVARELSGINGKFGWVASKASSSVLRLRFEVPWPLTGLFMGPHSSEVGAGADP